MGPEWRCRVRQPTARVHPLRKVRHANKLHDRGVPRQNLSSGPHCAGDQGRAGSARARRAGRGASALGADSHVASIPRGRAQTIDFQTIRVQEIMQDDSRESGYAGHSARWQGMGSTEARRSSGGSPFVHARRPPRASFLFPFASRIPRTVECELLHDLVDSCVPGDVVCVSGEVKVASTESGARNADKGLFLIYINANGIVNFRTRSQAPDRNEEDDVMDEHTTTDLYGIQQIQVGAMVWWGCGWRWGWGGGGVECKTGSHQVTADKRSCVLA